MHGDFSRRTHRPDRQYDAVAAQQGRVLLDAESNEQTALLLAARRAFARDVIGRHGDQFGGQVQIPEPFAWHGGLVNHAGFAIEPFHNEELGRVDLSIRPGRYYVDGIAVDATRPQPMDVVPEESDDSEAEAPPSETIEPASAHEAWTYWEQPYAYADPERDTEEFESGTHLVYLRVSDRLVTALQDEHLLEPALGPALPDTAARIRAEWQVKVHRLEPDDLEFGRRVPQELLDRIQAQRGRMAARAERPPKADDDPCLVMPEAGYRGPENQLYRVEVHAGGRVTGDGRANGPSDKVTVKWSRENGSVTFGITEVDGTWVTLAALGRDEKLDLAVGAWVEVLDDAVVGRGEVNPLLEVADVDIAGNRVKLSAEPEAHVAGRPELHPFLRRWDQVTPRRRAPKLIDGAVPVQPGGWIDLEAGVQIYFTPGQYDPGDYWTFPARTLTGDVEWPRDAAGRSALLDPEGVAYHYAPLAMLFIGDGMDTQDMRHLFCPLQTCEEDRDDT